LYSLSLAVLLARANLLYACIYMLWNCTQIKRLEHTYCPSYILLHKYLSSSSISLPIKPTITSCLYPGAPKLSS
jgi:hypothetical protein